MRQQGASVGHHVIKYVTYAWQTTIRDAHSPSLFLLAEQGLRSARECCVVGVPTGVYTTEQERGGLGLN